MNWKTLASKIIFKNNFFTLKTEKCLLPNNKIIEDYYLFECKDWVQVVSRNEDNNYIMVEQYRHGGKQSYLEFPGGVIDEGENPEEAAQREMLEETGYKASNLEYLGFSYPNPALQENKIHVYYTPNCTKVGEQSLDEHEEVNIRLVSSAELSNLISNNGHHSLMLSTYLILQNHLNK